MIEPGILTSYDVQPGTSHCKKFEERMDVCVLSLIAEAEARGELHRGYVDKNDDFLRGMYLRTVTKEHSSVGVDLMYGLAMALAV